MKKNYLIPHKWQKIGWFIFIPAVFIGFITMIVGLTIHLDVPFIKLMGGFMTESNFMLFEKTDIWGTSVSILIIISGLMIAFSKEKIEDECVAEIRLNALAWSIIINYAVLILVSILIWDFAFLHVLIYNMFTPLIIFIFRFRYLILKFKHQKELEG